MAAAARAALGKVALWSGVLGVGSFVMSEALYNVEGGHRAVIWHRFGGGIQNYVVGEGTHFRIPFVTYPTIFDVRMRPRVLTSRTGTKDLQQVAISLRVLSHPDPAHMSTIFQSLSADYEERVLPSIVNEVLKATVAQFDADQLLTQREKVSRTIREALMERATEFKIVLDDVSITHLAFSKEFTQAIEAKQVAQQDAERSKFIVMKAEQEKLAAIIRAEGESEAARLINEAMRIGGTAMIDVKRIDAARDIAEALSGSRNVVYVPSGLNMLMPAPAAGVGSVRAGPVTGAAELS